jgi:hypothetical protein
MGRRRRENETKCRGVLMRRTHLEMAGRTLRCMDEQMGERTREE